MASQITTRPIHSTPSLKLTSSHVASPRTMPQLRVNGSRMMDSIHATCEWGKAHPWGEYVVFAFNSISQ